MNARNTTIVGTLLVMLNSAGISGKSVFIPLCYRAGLTTGEIVIGRLVVSLPFFVLLWLLLAPKADRRLPDRKEAGFILGMVALSLVPLIAHTKAYDYISASLAAVLVYLFPTFVVVFEWVLYRQKPGPNVRLALPITYGGILLLVAGGDAALELHDWDGIWLTVASALVFAFYLARLSHAYAPEGPLRMSPISFSTAGAFVVPFVIAPFIWSDLRSFEQFTMGERPWLLLGLGVFSTTIPFAALMFAIKMIGATRSALISTITPVLSVILAAQLLGDTMDELQYLGVALVVVGLLSLRLRGLPLKRLGRKPAA